MKLSEFEPAHMQGLYHYQHFAHPNGAFIQVHVRGDAFVYQAPDGARFTRRTLAEIEKLVTG